MHLKWMQLMLLHCNAVFIRAAKVARCREVEKNEMKIGCYLFWSFCGSWTYLARSLPCRLFVIVRELLFCTRYQTQRKRVKQINHKRGNLTTIWSAHGFPRSGRGLVSNSSFIFLRCEWLTDSIERSKAQLIGGFIYFVTDWLLWWPNGWQICLSVS